MKKCIILCFAFLMACSDAEWQKLGGLHYKGDFQECDRSLNSFLLLDIDLKDAKDSSLINTQKIGRKLELSVQQIDSQSSLAKLITSMCPGDSVSVQLDLDSFYLALGGARPLQLNAGSGTLQLKLVDALSDLRYEAHKLLFEKQSIDEYVKRTRWSADYDSSTGIYFERIKSSRAPRKNFEKAKIAYIIKSLNQDLIEFSKESDPLIYDKKNKMLLKGMHFIAAQLKESERIRAILPSPMAYGADGSKRIPPYYPIVVEMELIEIIE